MITATRKEAEENDKLYCSDCLVYTNCEICGDRLKLGQDRFIELNKMPTCVDCARNKGNAVSPSQPTSTSTESTSMSSSSGSNRSPVIRWPLKIGARIIGVFAVLGLIRVLIAGFWMGYRTQFSLVGYVGLVAVVGIGLLILFNIADAALRYEP